MPYYNAVSDLGANGNGAADNYPLIASALAALPDRSTVYWPAGTYMTTRSLEVSANYLTMYGDGYSSRVSIYDNTYYMPALTVGVRKVEGTSSGGTNYARSVTRAYRPDLFGVLDSSYAPAANARWGFRTNGDAVCRAYSGPGSCGALTAFSTGNGTRLFDYWGEATGVTVRVCLFLTASSVGQMRANGNGASIIGLGDVSQPGPWKLGVDSANPCNLFFTFRTNDQGVDSWSPRRYFRFPMPTSGGRAVTGGVIHDVEVYVNFLDGTYGANVNNAPATVVNTSNMTGLAGKRFAKNRGYDFTVGPVQNDRVFNFSWGPVPDFGVYAFNVLRVAQQASANTDAARYSAVANTVLSTDISESPALSLERSVLLKCGSCVPFNGSAMRLFHTNPDLGFEVLGTVRNMAFNGSLGLGTFNHFDITGVDCTSGMQGLEHLNLGTAYTVNVTGGRFGGFDAAVDLGEAIADFHGTRVQGMGDVAMRFRASNVTSNGLFVSGFQDGGRAVVDMIAGDTNGIYTYRGCRFDQEGFTVQDPDGDGGAVFKIDIHPNSPNTVLTVEDCQQDSSGSSAAVFLLRGRRGSGGGGTLNASGLQVGPNNGRLVKVVDPDWRATIDRRGLTVTACEGDTTSLGNFAYAGEGGGAPGPPGSVWRSAAGVPANGLGTDGDYYLDTASGNVYARAAGAYAVRANLTGPAGSGGSGGGSPIRTEL